MDNAGRILKDLRRLTDGLQDQTKRELDALIHAEEIRPREALEETTITLGYRIDELQATLATVEAEAQKLRVELANSTSYLEGIVEDSTFTDEFIDGAETQIIANKLLTRNALAGKEP